MIWVEVTSDARILLHDTEVHVKGSSILLFNLIGCQAKTSNNTCYICTPHLTSGKCKTGP